jgi:23S rRNA pseudouridine1911/1915/1917 synthase
VAAEAAGAAGRAAFARGGVWRNRVRIRDAAARVAAGDTIFIHTPPGGAYRDVVLDPRRIIFEDDDLLALDKPPGVYVESTPWDDDGHLRGAVAHFLGERGRVAPGDPYLHLVHRLDRDTSGVLLLSKRQEVNAALQRAFVEGLVNKRYLCVCAGEPPAETFVAETGHGRGRQGLFRIYPLEEVGRELPGGARVKPMLTRFTVLRRMGDSALVLAEPVTGRTHQIRLHLAHLGHPLIGDARYGGPAEWRGEVAPQHLLHAETLSLPHPRTGSPLTIRAPAPEWAGK